MFTTWAAGHKYTIPSAREESRLGVKANSYATACRTSNGKKDTVPYTLSKNKRLVSPLALLHTISRWV